MYSRVESGDKNWAYLFINGVPREETDHYTFSERGVVRFTSGRVVTLEFRAGDRIEIRTTKLDGHYDDIIYCAEYISKM